MGFKNQAGLGVSNYYGARDTGGTVGIEDSDGSNLVVSVQLTGQSINDGYLPPVVIPKGALLRRAVLRVDEAFALTGTSPTVLIGMTGSVATNGIILTETELEAIGTKVPASDGEGTWDVASATGVTAAGKVALALGGTSPVVSSAVGKAVLVLEFVNKAKA